MEERKISTLVSLLGEDVLTEDCLVVVTGGNNDKEHFFQAEDGIRDLCL